MWFASSWWRLNYEPLPKFGIKPQLDWRMSHELGAANHGFVWPRILFAADGEAVNIWAEAANTKGQSITYLHGLESQQSVSIANFQSRVGAFIESVLSRLAAVECAQSDLRELWSLVQEDSDNPDALRIRQLEALMGFDPEECPEPTMAEALRIQDQIGVGAMSELAPVFGRRAQVVALDDIVELASMQGIIGEPISDLDGAKKVSSVPWQQGVEVARQLRQHIGNEDGPIGDDILFSLLGITKHQVESFNIGSNRVASVAKSRGDGKFDFIPRKKHPLGKRFEFARFLGDCLSRSEQGGGWLVTSDLTTARQKRQRAFAAEFLCPIQALVNFLDDDYSESAIEEAVDHFHVSDKTIESLLANHGYLEMSSVEPRLPYRLAA